MGQIHLIEKLFGEFYIAQAVWEELKNYENPKFDNEILQDLEKHVIKTKSENYLSVVMDYGESESVILCKELQADYLLIDDNKARTIAEALEIRCIGSVGLLIKAKQLGLVEKLKPIFTDWLENGRYFSKRFLNSILKEVEEEPFPD
ncbi:DUF3368 domain-containing protein [Salmonirosea aquatica]|uniref:DUF3368 domain-containing protein n=1 Tax=Salmonirosea aquatica TaxID=2654236 RepID=A0A7C9FXW0_9BACT|nr:DUF3368 domain-containing protein [Cytophagaceae bacterium SJW1-29]